MSIHRWWEDLCTSCGICCHEKTLLGRDTVIIHMDKPCEYLDKETNLCSCYPTRFKENPRCVKVHLGRAMLSGSLPATCGYVQCMSRLKLRWSRKDTIIEESH